MSDDRDTGGVEAPPGRSIAVAIHGIEPATFERCALIRDWLCDHGVDRATLLVIPARDLHPFGERSPEMLRWLTERRRAGDGIAQHGFRHLQARRARGRGLVGSPRHILAPGAPEGSAEFLGLDDRETRHAVEAGWRVLKLAGVEPDGFVAPAYAYTPALRETLHRRYRWWAGLLRVHRTAPGAPREPLAPAWSLATGGPLRRALSPALVRLGSRLSGETLRLDLHPDDLERPRHILALESVLRRAGAERTAITYEELALAGIQSPRLPAPAREDFRAEGPDALLRRVA